LELSVKVYGVSLSQPCNPWEKVMEQKALKAARVAITSNVWELSVPPPKGTISQNVITWYQRWLKSETCRQNKI
jgi:hypothetical protein